jgi:hypothetical protein
MEVKVTNIGGHEIHRAIQACPKCDQEMQNIFLYGYVCMDCAEKSESIIVGIPIEPEKI